MTNWSGWAGNIIANVDTGLSTGSVVLWLQNSLYKLNLAINTNFYLDTGNYIAPDTMTAVQSGIYGEMYYCDYLAKKSSQAVAYNDYDWSEIEGEKQGRIRRTSKNEHSKNLRLQADKCREDIKAIIDGYFNNYSNGILVGQVLYNDRGNVSESGLNWGTPPSEVIE